MSLLTLYDPNIYPDILEFSFICRICLKSDSLQPIFAYRDRIHPSEVTNLANKIMLCSDISINEEDELPGNICEKCVNILYIAHHFRLLSENSNKKLKSIVEKTKNNNLSTRHIERTFIDRSKIEFRKQLAVIRKNKDILKTNPLESSTMIVVYEHEPDTHQIDDKVLLKEEMSDQDDVLPQITAKIADSNCIDDSDNKHLEYLTVKLNNNCSGDTVPNSNTKNPLKLDDESRNFMDLEEDDSLDVPLLSLIEKGTKNLNVEQAKKNRNFKLTPFSNKESKFKLMKGDLSCYGCLLCGKQLYRKTTLDRHMLVEHGDRKQSKDYKCYGCEEIFKTRYGRMYHEANSCANMPSHYQCRKCDSNYKSRVDFDVHLRVHRLGTQPAPARTLELAPLHRCQFCSYTAKGRTSVRAHIRSKHTAERPYVCEVCGKGFFTSTTLYSHRVIHSNVKKHSCSYCSYSTKIKSALVVHERRHTMERPYTCDICGRPWSSSSTLLRHRRTHDNRKPFQCDMCDKRFGLKASLTHHISSFHMGLKPHVCTMCDCAYARKRELRRHHKRCHGIVTTPQERHQPAIASSDSRGQREADAGLPEGSKDGAVILDFDNVLEIKETQIEKK